MAVQQLRRRYPRFKLDAPASIACAAVERTAMRLVDVSIKGCRGVANCVLDPGNEVEIFLNAPTVKDPVTRKATVVWARPAEDSMFEAGFSVNYFDLENFSPEYFTREMINPAEARTMPRFGREDMSDDRADYLRPAIIALTLLMLAGIVLFTPLSEPAREVGKYVVMSLEKVLLPLR
ncbi:MAG: PilZ domain-containing protein [Candidatus Omnitrophica bacterium]|nr:PilZ domain-containing protein [Candidatus Omnitrophota bacterium]